MQPEDEFAVVLTVAEWNTVLTALDSIAVRIGMTMRKISAQAAQQELQTPPQRGDGLDANAKA